MLKFLCQLFIQIYWYSACIVREMHISWCLPMLVERVEKVGQHRLVNLSGIIYTLLSDADTHIT